VEGIYHASGGVLNITRDSLTIYEPLPQWPAVPGAPLPCACTNSSSRTLRRRRPRPRPSLAGLGRGLRVRTPSPLQRAQSSGLCNEMLPTISLCRAAAFAEQRPAEQRVQSSGLCNEMLPTN
jgi:hypothetical protein